MVFLSPLLRNFTLEYVIGKIQVLGGTENKWQHQCLIYADYLNLLGESEDTIHSFIFIHLLWIFSDMGSVT